MLVDFWTYSCINCLRAIPYVRAWDVRTASRGSLSSVCIRRSSRKFEKNVANVSKAITDLQIRYPVAIDNDYAIWRAFDNRYWPAHYFIDAAGRVRHHHFGEGEYDESERVIQQLLAEAGGTPSRAAAFRLTPRAPRRRQTKRTRCCPKTYVG